MSSYKAWRKLPGQLGELRWVKYFPGLYAEISATDTIRPAYRWWFVPLEDPEGMALDVGWRDTLEGAKRAVEDRLYPIGDEELDVDTEGLSFLEEWKLLTLASKIDRGSSR